MVGIAEITLENMKKFVKRHKPEEYKGFLKTAKDSDYPIYLDFESILTGIEKLDSYNALLNVIKNQNITSIIEKTFLATFGNDSLPPILFIHGAPGRWEGFSKQLDDKSYQEKFHLLAPDRPGYGKSYYKKKYKHVSIEIQAEILEKVIELNKSSKKAIIVSRSYGAPIGAFMVAKNPEKYQKLIMMAPAINPDAEKFFKFSK